MYFINRFVILDFSLKEYPISCAIWFYKLLKGTYLTESCHLGCRSKLVARSIGITEKARHSQKLKFVLQQIIYYGRKRLLVV